ncbi:MAG TPA: ABC transporter permease [Terriglobia bacterium]|nr:ABC transporter permease [Terriglobia bacterium]
MNWRKIKYLWLSRRRMAEREMNDELQSLAQTARRQELGNLTLTAENVRSAWAWTWLESILADVRYAFRVLRKNPGFSAAAIAIAALGIAAACVIFSFAEAAVLRALPYKDPSSLVSVAMTDARFSHAWDRVPAPVFLNWRARAKDIGDFAASQVRMGQTLAGVPEPTQVFDYAISPTMLPLLGARLALGRGFLPSDYRSGGPPAVLLSYPLWQQLFHGRRDILGRTITLDGVSHTLVGVMTPDFIMPGTTSWESVCWTPLVFDAQQRSDAKTRALPVLARLRPGVSPAQAEAALSVLADQVMRQAGSEPGAEWRITATPLTHAVIAGWRSILIVLFGAAAFLLAISCANVTNLLLARAATRRKEIAVRTAIGARRGRIVRQLLTESLILAGGGGAFGILLAHWGIELESRFFPRALHTANFQNMGVDWRVLAATLLISAVVGIVFGLAPAFYASRVDLVESLKEGSISGAPRRGQFNLRSALIVAEVALSLVLLTAAGLMLRSFLNLEGVRPGLDPREVLTLRVLLPGYRFTNSADQIAAYQRLLDRIHSVPGVEASGFISPLPLDGINGTFRDTAEPGMSNVDQGGVVTGGLHAVSPGYFKAMGIPLLYGRDFTAQDTAQSERVMIVNQAFVDRYWMGRSPVGKGSKDGRVVGEVRSVRDYSLAKDPRPEVYVPFTQKLFAAFAGTIVVKTRTPASTAVAMQKAIHSLDPEAPITQIETMRQVLSGSLGENRFYLLVVAAFALLALLLAAAGIASTISYAVSSRRHEIGIRMALGAGRPAIIALMAGQTLKLVIAGIALGTVGSLMLTQFVASQLYGVSPTDPLTFLGVAALLIAVSVFASIIPATKAISVDPVDTLRAS